MFIYVIKLVLCRRCYFIGMSNLQGKLCLNFFKTFRAKCYCMCSQVLQVDAIGSDSVCIVQAPTDINVNRPIPQMLVEANVSRYGREYQTGKSQWTPYTNPFKKRGRGKGPLTVREWPQYTPEYVIDVTRRVPEELYKEYLQWMAIPKARIETRTVTITPNWLDTIADQGQWLEDTVSELHIQFPITIFLTQRMFIIVYCLYYST